MKKKKCINISVFGYENKEKYPVCVSNTFKRNFDLLLIGEDKRLINDIITLMSDHTLHCGRKNVCHCCVQAFSTAEILMIALKSW